ncbi:MAG TPA: SUMF1/EgtB/PvdO family nonheme iron enzyme [Sedimentisphaerales bacterium]|nr:SUMF1/EgtB/PvdO family nonheme iron enzyme [Sedimentisphaerales bacterium]
MNSSNSKHRIICIAVASLAALACASPAEMPTAGQYTNSIGMKLVRIEDGAFQMGQLKTPLPSEILPMFRGRGRVDCLTEGDYDEKPVHAVTITGPFYMGVFEVTNLQYELFDPEHKQLRVKDGSLSSGDDEAVINVNWYEAQAFCRWLCDKEGLPYRLPTEAEWEYACRAGTTSNYYAGDVLPEQFSKRGGKTSLQVGMTPPNGWGLYDMHGNVEEWCSDWYGPYPLKAQTDPVGYIRGDFKVLRGGSHSTPEYYLRSANRMGQLPECKNWLMGFRVVLGELPGAKPMPMPEPARYQKDVVERNPADVTRGPDRDKPYFRGPYKYVKIPTDATGPLFAAHNHDPAIVECPNGDLIACWYTCVDEGARELAQAASRLRRGEVEWEPASPFWDAPDRNDHAPAMWFDGPETIYHFTGVGADGGRGRMVMVMRSSKDSGATWSAPRAIVPDFTGGHQLSEPVFRMHDGTIVLTVDGRRTLWMSSDEGLTWDNPGGDILGIHAGVTQLKDGSIFAFSRSNGDRETMPISISRDRGKTFTYEPSEFQPIGGGQRLVLLRLKEGPLFFASFANHGEGMEITDSTGTKRNVRGLFAAVSEDEGRTWPYKRLLSDDGPGRTIECTDGGAVVLSARSAEYRGYLSVCQSADSLIHLISSRNHYAFNLKWIKTAPPPPPAPPVRVRRLVETFDGPSSFDNEGWVEYKGFSGGFDGRGQFTVNAHVHYEGLNRIVGKGSFEAVFSVKNIHYNPPGPNISEGVTLGFKDAFNNQNPTMFVWIKENSISGNVFKGIRLSEPPRAVKLRFVWNEKTRQWKIFYGLNGDEPTTEVAESKAGIYYESPTSESFSAFLLMSNGQMDIDHFQITPTEP